ncbi:MAG: hypothetical protein EPN88_17980 [Bacteroidetes bacterium]|nr:MAG: hypothetical protein EPN88_17980 [Bacteroidota bacterium]
MKSLKTHFFTLICFIITTFSLYSQNKLEKNNFKIRDYTWIEAGSNYSWYKNSIGDYNLGNYEIDLGLSFQHKVVKFFNFKTSLMCGVKIKKPYIHRFDLNDRNLNYKKPIPEPLYAFYEIDRFDRLLSHNYYYMELPISMGCIFFRKLHIDFGYTCRYYFPQNRNEKYDFIFNSNFENGLTSGVSINLSSRFIIQCNCFIAIKPSYNSIGIINEKLYLSEFNNRAFQLSLSYKIKDIPGK